MTIVEIAAQVVETKSAHLLRYRSNSVIETGTAQYDCKPIFTGSKKGWIVLDLFTASALTKGYAALKPENQAKFNNVPLGKLVGICMTWKLCHEDVLVGLDKLWIERGVEYWGYL